eukprot:s60_g1.t1
MADFSSILPHVPPPSSGRNASSVGSETSGIFLAPPRRSKTVSPSPPSDRQASPSGENGNTADSSTPRAMSLNLKLYLPGAFPPEVQEDHQDDQRDGLKSPAAPAQLTPRSGSCRSFNSIVAVDLETGAKRPSKSSKNSVNAPSAGCAASHEPQRGTSKQSVLITSHQEKISTRCSAFTVAKIALNQTTKSFERLGFVEAIEPAMQLYLEDCCVDGPSALKRAARTTAVLLGLLMLLPLFSFATLMMPFPAPHEGFLSNWAFNFLAHPVLNYVPARAQMQMISRIVEPSERPRIRWIVLWVPLVDPIVCLTIHSVASLFGVYPLPYAVLTGCIPGILAALVVARLVVPNDLLTADVLAFMKFNLLSWLVWAIEFAVLMVWLLAFPLLSPLGQALFSFAVTGMMTGVGWAMEMIGLRMGLPKYFCTELKIPVLFISFLFTAALLSSSKTIWVFILMLTQDAGKALAILMKIWFFLSKIFARERNNVEESEETVGKALSKISKTAKYCQQCLDFIPDMSTVQEMYRSALETLERLRLILEEFKWHTRESLQHATIKVSDARLLDNFARFLVLFTMLEICEVLVPLIYIIVSSLLHAPGLGHNRQYFYIFKDMQLEDALLGNLIAFLIEASIFTVTHLVFLRAIGFNLLNFAGRLVLRMDFWYWTFALGACCVAWSTVLIAHTGHDLESRR